MNKIKFSYLAVLLGIFIILVPAKSFSQSLTKTNNIGLGVMFGEPTGISFKSWNNSKTAYDGGIAWSFSGEDAIHIHGDFLWHIWLDEEPGKLALYYGIGVRALFADDFTVGVRIPVGLNYMIEDSPVGVFLEIAPILDLIPNTDGDGNGAIGVRYYF